MEQSTRGNFLSWCARFGILKKVAKKEDSYKEQKESMTEQQPKEQPRRESTPGREFTPQQKVSPCALVAISTAFLSSWLPLSPPCILILD